MNSQFKRFNLWNENCALIGEFCSTSEIFLKETLYLLHRPTITLCQVKIQISDSKMINANDKLISKSEQNMRKKNLTHLFDCN